MKIVIATIKSWNIENARKFKERWGMQHDIWIITHKDGLHPGLLDEICPDYIFFPHWSYFIPEAIFLKYTCVIFHMTDLPFGRGGSPLQNLIARGFEKTKISAVKAVKEIDAGPVYMKEEVPLDGSAAEIFERVSGIIFKKMIPRFWESSLQPVEQKGEAVFFKRRKPADSQLFPDMDTVKIYDYIRMLDAEGYPKAYLCFGRHKVSFKNARLEGGTLTAEAVIEDIGGIEM